MSDLVRARYKGRETTLSRFFADRLGVEVLDEPPLNLDGSLRRPTGVSGRPDKPKTTVAEQVAAKKAVSSADTPKEK